MTRGLRMAILLLATTLAIPGSAATAPSAAAAGAVLEEWARARLLTERLRILPGPRAAPGACLEIGAEQLSIRLRGRPVDDPAAAFLVRELAPNFHAILIDTSASMDGDLEQVAAAAADYVRGLPLERDRALVATFDHRVALLQPATADRGRLLAPLERLRGGLSTTLFDALVRGIDEASVQRERPVVIVLTDGHDVGSLHETRDVRALVGRRPDLTIFTILFRAPEISGSAPTGMLASRRMLARLAERTGGGYFPVDSGRRLTEVYRRIREMLESEALLTVIDPEPDGEPGRLSVSSRVPECEVRMLGTAAAEDGPAAIVAPGAATTAIPLRPDRAIARLDYLDTRDRLDPACRGAPADTWYLANEADRIEGCALDIAMERGPLYDPFAGGGALWTRSNPIAEVRGRALRIAVPPLAGLPRRPEETLEALAGDAVARIDRPIAGDATKVPERLHARPYYDLPWLTHGSTLFELRRALARALWAREDYRADATRRLREEADRDLEMLRLRLARLAPGASPLGVDQAIEQNAEAKQLRRRADEPTEADLVRALGAWLGDIRAYELFLRWERLWIERWLAGTVSDGEVATFVEGWQALRRLLLAPSYAHTLTLLAPVRDAESGRIGFWRILLPDLRRLGQRVKGRARDGDLGGAELDLLPDAPLALEALRGLARDRPELVDQIRREGYRLQRTSYTLRGAARRWFPERAFRESRVTLDFRQPGGRTTAPGLRIDAELQVTDGEGERRGAVRRVEIRTTGDEP